MDEGNASHAIPTAPEHDAISSTHQDYVSAIEEAQLSPDGTCIFTADYDRKFSVYTIAHNILEAEPARSLTPYAQFTSPDPIYAFATSPFFSLQDAYSAQILVSKRDHYIDMHNAIWDMSNQPTTTYRGPKPGPIDISHRLASYKLIDNLTEEVIAPLSLTYTSHGTHFITGSKNRIDIFDLTYTDAPTTTLRTIPSTRSKLKDGGRGFKGTVTSLAISPASDMLAAGTRTRYVALYDAEGSGEQITHFPLPGTINRNKVNYASEKLQGLIGNGVTQLKWSPCGYYLYIAERDSDALMIYDVRNYSFALGHCRGRNAMTKQKLGFDIWALGGDEEAGHEVWAGGADGHVRAWRNPHRQEGAVMPDEVFDVGGEPVSATMIHSSGSLAIIAKGSRTSLEEREKGRLRGGGKFPRFREWGCLDIFGLGSYDAGEQPP